MPGHTGLWYEKLLSGHPCECLFGIETETLAVFVIARQLGDHADHLDVAPLPFIRQRNGEALLGLPCGMIETQSAGEGRNQQCASKAQDQRLGRDQQHKRKGKQ